VTSQKLGCYRRDCWFDSHCRFLPSGHAFRKNRKALLKGKVETNDPSPTMTPDLVWGRVRDLSMATENPRLPKLRGYGEFHNWRKKKYILESSLLER